jgi:hypothetical protein|tara:strand:+ start:1033 stop:1224 length:192 start_codon:yes stop_codon:yes gene_type:complete
MVITIGKTNLMEILLIIILTGIAILYFLFHPIKTIKWILIALGVLIVGTLAWALLFAGLLSLA